MQKNVDENSPYFQLKSSSAVYSFNKKPLKSVSNTIDFGDTFSHKHSIFGKSKSLTEIKSGKICIFVFYDTLIQNQIGIQDWGHI